MNVHRIAAITSSAVVLVLVLAGLYFSGLPQEQRLLRIDERRVNDLIRISMAITDYRQRHGRLPGELADLVDGQRLRSLPADPETGALYGFTASEPALQDSHSYELCADFSRASVNSSAGTTAPNDFWNHGAGRHCFLLDAGQ